MIEIVMLCALKAGSFTAVSNSTTSRESVSSGDEWDVEETPGDTSTSTWRVSMSTVVYDNDKESCDLYWMLKLTRVDLSFVYILFLIWTSMNLLFFCGRICVIFCLFVLSFCRGQSLFAVMKLTLIWRCRATKQLEELDNERKSLTRQNKQKDTKLEGLYVTTKAQQCLNTSVLVHG